MIDRVAYLSLHSCPLAQPGSGDAGGMNVYFRELGRAMAERGIDVVMFTRRSDDNHSRCRRGHARVPRGAHRSRPTPQAPDTPTCPGLVGEFAEATLAWIDENGAQFDIIHSHYWLSGWAGFFSRRNSGFRSPTRSTRSAG